MSSPAVATVPATRPAATRWEIDPSHSGVHFSIRHMMFANVRGEFGRLSGTVELDAADLTRSVVRASIDAASISTREPQRDQHLRSPDFLDVASYPTIEFVSTGVVRTGEETLEITGDLTIHGVTRDITLKVETDGAELRDLYGNTRRGAVATATLNRTDFGLTWNAVLETGGFLVGEELKVTIDVQLIRAAATA
jgi:polyisoprenoid-binding protein YceI